MIAPDQLLARAAFDPLVRYTLSAAVILAAASLVGGAGRRDLVALIRPAGWVAVATAVLASLGLEAVSNVLVGTVAASVPVQGWERIPLYLLAIGYGPGVGAVAASAHVVAQPGPVGSDVAQLSLVLETVAVGWLALGPSPRTARWAAPLATLAGWALATVPLQLAMWSATGRGASLTPFLLAASSHIGGPLVAGLIATVPPPSWWKRSVPGASDGVLGLRPEGTIRWIRPLARPPRPRRSDRIPRGWASPPRPAALRRQPPPFRSIETPPRPNDLRPDPS